MFPQCSPKSVPICDICGQTYSTQFPRFPPDQTELKILSILPILFSRQNAHRVRGAVVVQNTSNMRVNSTHSAPSPMRNCSDFQSPYIPKRCRISEFCTTNWGPPAPRQKYHQLLTATLPNLNTVFSDSTPSPTRRNHRKYLSNNNLQQMQPPPRTRESNPRHTHCFYQPTLLLFPARPIAGAYVPPGSSGRPLFQNSTTPLPFFCSAVLPLSPPRSPPTHARPRPRPTCRRGRRP